MAKSVTCLVITLAIFSVAASIDEKCGACNAVAEELERGLSKEKTRNHLDLRHRLDSKGQREGKLIDYRVSELRVVELLDGLCDKMQDYTLEKIDSTRQDWIRVDNWENLSISMLLFFHIINMVISLLVLANVLVKVLFGASMMLVVL
ncbi:hypothetical protein CISIN_1g030030mg [Citrus sinensis]|uniref:DUF3456 domain-containing protein n=1 Tax=Citrus sinensis TaxID=2711 RepID=A0A067HBD0_CITSI|nr:hypothetical protein CISIN_1g030030mg [Citrus sinensis]